MYMTCIVGIVTFIFFRFAHESSFNEEQTSAFFTILHILMNNIKGDKYVTQFEKPHLWCLIILIKRLPLNVCYLAILYSRQTKCGI